MEKIRVTNINLSGEPAKFTDSIKLVIEFDALAIPKFPLEWKFIYVGSVESSEYDQVLEQLTILVEQVGKLSFEVNVPPPIWKKIPTLDDLLSPSAFMVSALYLEQEFFRASYYVNNIYTLVTDEIITENNFGIQFVERSINSKDPRIGLADIDWNDEIRETCSKFAKVSQPEKGQLYEKQTEDQFDKIANPFSISENSFLGNRY